MLTCLITHRGKTVVVVDGTKEGNVQGKDTSFLGCGMLQFLCLSYPSTKLLDVAREIGINEKMLVSQHPVEERKLNSRENHQQGTRREIIPNN